MATRGKAGGRGKEANAKKAKRGPKGDGRRKLMARAKAKGNHEQETRSLLGHSAKRKPHDRLKVEALRMVVVVAVPVLVVTRVVAAAVGW